MINIVKLPFPNKVLRLEKKHKLDLLEELSINFINLNNDSVKII